MKFIRVHPRSGRIAAAAFLFALNAWVCARLFTTSYTNHLESIEAAYISLSQYFLNHPFSFGWFPLWYNGIPYPNTYPPLLHILVAGVAWLLRISPALAHHAVCAALYSLGPVTLFLMAGRISNAWGASFLASLAYSLLAPSTWIIPAVRGWAGGGSNIARLQSLVKFGDGPHVAALTLLPLAILALHCALERWSSVRAALAAIAFAAVVLTNWLGAFALAIAVVAYLLARIGEPTAIPRTLLISIIAYCLSAPWLTLSTLRAVRDNAQYVIGLYPLGAKQAVAGAIVLAAALALAWLLRRLRIGLFGRFVSILLFLFACLVLADAWFKFYLMPQPHRYNLELEMAICLAGTFAIAALSRRLDRRIEVALLVVVALLFARELIRARRFARSTIHPIDMTQTVEYRAPHWMSEHLPDTRVFISGAIQFWLTAFTSTPEIGGGYGQGVTNPTIPIIHFGIPFTSGDGARCAMWVRLYGGGAIVVSEKNGRDAYHEIWHDPDKFHGVLPELWREGGDVIYDIPERSRSLAHVIHPGDAPARPPINVTDDAPVQALAKALEDPSLPLANFEWRGTDRARIATNMTRDQSLFVQLSFDRGWKAFVDGARRSIHRDALGMMLIDPQCSGPCAVDLAYDGGAEMKIAEALRALAILAVLAWFIVWRISSRRLYKASALPPVPPT